MVLARGRDRIVTDSRILTARGPSESLSFSHITRWSLGRQHDHRPLIRLEHTPIERPEHVPAHHFLWFEWGDAEEPVPKRMTLLAFARDTDPVFIAIRTALERVAVPQAASFVIRPEGTRQERMGNFTLLKRATPLRMALFRSQRAIDRLRRDRLAWRVRLPSWLIVAIPAWFIDPWLVLPAILLAEVLWIVFLQISWRRERKRRQVR